MMNWKVILCILFCAGFFCATSFAQTKYFNQTFGHIHTKPYSSSPSATGLSCGEIVTMNKSNASLEKDWESVSFGDKKGYVYIKHLSNYKPSCLQEDYPAFFQALELDLTEIYLWGKLGDHFIEFESGEK